MVETQLFYCKTTIKRFWYHPKLIIKSIHHKKFHILKFLAEGFHPRDVKGPFFRYNISCLVKNGIITLLEGGFYEIIFFKIKSAWKAVTAAYTEEEATAQNCALKKTARSSYY